MKIDCISDLHGYFPKLEGGDLLIVAGDLTARDEYKEYIDFGSWIFKQNYKKKILIAGNHDNWIFSAPMLKNTFPFVEYLCDSGTEFEGLKIWGSPWTKRFEGMNPKCMAFMVDTEEELYEKWEQIPCDVDVLITHSPPRWIMDKVQDMSTGRMEHCGSMRLSQQVERWRPKLHVFGHVHEGYGKEVILWHKDGETVFVNASYVNQYYKPVNNPIRVELHTSPHMDKAQIGTSVGVDDTSVDK